MSQEFLSSELSKLPSSLWPSSISTIIWPLLWVPKTENRLCALYYKYVVRESIIEGGFIKNKMFIGHSFEDERRTAL